MPMLARGRCSGFGCLGRTLRRIGRWNAYLRSSYAQSPFGWCSVSLHRSYDHFLIKGQALWNWILEGSSNQLHYSLQAFKQINTSAIRTWREMPTREEKFLLLFKMCQGGKNEPRLVAHLLLTLGCDSLGWSLKSCSVGTQWQDLGTPTGWGSSSSLSSWWGQARWWLLLVTQLLQASLWHFWFSSIFSFDPNYPGQRSFCFVFSLSMVFNISVNYPWTKHDDTSWISKKTCVVYLGKDCSQLSALCINT